MLTADSSLFIHRMQNAALILISFAFLPLSTGVLLASLVLDALGISTKHSREIHQKRPVTPSSKTILVTGVGMTKGLCLARMFYEAGHTVVGADFSDLACGRVSKSIKKFYRLSKPTEATGSSRYIEGLIHIINTENIDLWVSCSGVASAIEDGEAKDAVEARTKCKAIQFNVQDIKSLHEKYAFIERTKSLGLPVPETHYITNRTQVDKILEDNSSGKKKYIMKTVLMDDSVRADMTLLPRTTPKETAAHLSKLRISGKTPWILQRFLEGPEYCTHALVIRGQVKAFVACPSAELLMHYEALPETCAEYKTMLDFTKSFAAKSGSDFTGHLSFDFLAATKPTEKSSEPELFPIECNPRAHTAVRLFTGTPNMVDAYLSVLDNEPNTTSAKIVTPKYPQKIYWVGHDVFEFILLPVYSMLLRRCTLSYLRYCWSTFLAHFVYWSDGTYELWDPLPWFWLYHVYWPVQFWNSIWNGRKWSRINVSTTKMFEC